MAMNIGVLTAAIVLKLDITRQSNGFDPMTTLQKAEVEPLIESIAGAIIDHIKATAVVTIPPGVPVTTPAGPGSTSLAATGTIA